MLTLSAAALGLGLTGTGRAAHAMPGMTMPALPAAATSRAVQRLSLTQGWVSAAPPGAEELAAYLVLSNPGQTAVTLVGVSSPVSAQAMLMTTGKVGGGRETMRMVSALKIPPGGSLKILPGSGHLMLRALKRQPQPGENVSVTLRFSDGSARTVTLPVKRFP